MPILLKTCKCKKFWKDLLLKFSEEKISRNPLKDISEVLRSLRLQDQSYEWSNLQVKRTTPLRHAVDGKLTCQRWTDTVKTECCPEWLRV